MKTMYPESILRQFIYESEEWGRLLAFLKQENVMYKLRLSEMVNSLDDEEVVAEAEKFNDDFLSQDGIVDFLITELRSQNKLLKKESYLDGKVLTEMMRNQKRLRADIEKAEEIFSGTKKNFSGFVSSRL